MSHPLTGVINLTVTVCKVPTVFGSLACSIHSPFPHTTPHNNNYPGKSSSHACHLSGQVNGAQVGPQIVLSFVWSPSLSRSESQRKSHAHHAHQVWKEHNATAWVQSVWGMVGVGRYGRHKAPATEPPQLFSGQFPPTHWGSWVFKSGSIWALSG